jgi:hypothetical protein
MFYSNLQNPEFCLIQVSDVEDTDRNSNATFWQAIHYKDGNYVYTDAEGPNSPKNQSFKCHELQNNISIHNVNFITSLYSENPPSKTVATGDPSLMASADTPSPMPATSPIASNPES